MKKTNKHFKASQGKITVNYNKSQYFYNKINCLCSSVLYLQTETYGKNRFLQKNVWFFLRTNVACRRQSWVHPNQLILTPLARLS